MDDLPAAEPLGAPAPGIDARVANSVAAGSPATGSPATGFLAADSAAVDSLAIEARRLRTVERLSVRQIQHRLGVGKDRLQQMLRGVPAPEWTKRPNAKDDLRARAVELRAEGRSVVDIALELGVAKSTAYQWVKHLPLDRDSDAQRTRRREHSRRMTDARWQPYREARDTAHATAVAAAVAWVGSLSPREVILVGAATYWSEGCKAKPWRPTDFRVRFINSDPGLVLLFLRFVEALGHLRAMLRFRVSIHETADAADAMRWWAELVGVDVDAFQPPSLKRHRPATRRRNVDEGYRGCLIIDVPRSRGLYWKIEGIMRGMVGEDPGRGR